MRRRRWLVRRPIQRSCDVCVDAGGWCVDLSRGVCDVCVDVGGWCVDLSRGVYAACIDVGSWCIDLSREVMECGSTQVVGALTCLEA